MRITILTLLLLSISIVTLAQDTSGVKKDTLWTPRGVVGINLSQVAFDNWSQGGQNSLSFTFFSLLGIDYLGDPWKWRNSLKFSYGGPKSEVKNIEQMIMKYFFRAH